MEGDGILFAIAAGIFLLGMASGCCLQRIEVKTPQMEVKTKRKTEVEEKTEDMEENTTRMEEKIYISEKGSCFHIFKHCQGLNLASSVQTKTICLHCKRNARKAK